MNTTIKNTLTMEDISIEFPGVKALNQVSFSLESSTIHALIGANGAGKSTLMKILAGAYNHYTGHIRINGREVVIKTPKEANRLGIHIVYQEVDMALIPNLTVGENIMLDKLVNNMDGQHFINWQTIHKEAQAILSRLHININTKKLISELSLAQKQMVLITRSLSNQCRFLILDEPTAPLSHHETKELFRVIGELKKNDVGIIFISHRLPEVFAVCEDVTILRDGEIAAKDKLVNFTQNQLVEKMLGRTLVENFSKPPVIIGDTVLEAVDLCTADKLHNINFTVHSGEIVGIAGLVGAGKTELCKALFGAESLTAGKRLLYKQPLNFSSPHDAVTAGFALVPEERRKEGLFVEESIATNLTIANLTACCSYKHFISPKAESQVAKRMIERLDIKTPSQQHPAKNLSGGNQQKIGIAKWLLQDANIYILDEPTKGVDVGAKKDIFDLIGKLVATGKSILYASCEINELLKITDRLYVMYDGTIVKELKTNGTNEEEILFYATGGL
jgi:simple sugar transport system ATP-binding protein